MAMRWRWPPENSCGYCPGLGGAGPPGEHFSGLLTRCAAWCGPGPAAVRSRSALRFAVVQRAVRVLKHHLKVAPGLAQRGRRQLVQIAPQQPHAAGGGRVQRHHGARQGGFARAGFAHHAQAAPAMQREAYAFECLHFGGRAQQVVAGQCIREPGRSLAAAGLWALARLGWCGSEVMNGNAAVRSLQRGQGLRRATWPGAQAAHQVVAIGIRGHQRGFRPGVVAGLCA